MEGYGIPHRKPVGGAIPLRSVHTEQQQQLPSQQQSAAPSHGHSRSVSSSIFPNSHTAPTMSPTTQTFTQTIYPQKAGHSRRTASTTTTSTNSSQGPLGRHTSSVSISLRRSTSGRSGQSMTPTSYVALMRKQKATVWCDRAQHEDPRMAAQAKAAKMRATMEVVGGPTMRTSTSASTNNGVSGVRSKIRHHGAPKAVGYSPASLLVGAQGVPMRLSASEVEDQDHSGGDDDAASGGMHNRSGSGRSSLASNVQAQRLAPFSHRPRPSTGSANTPPSAQGASPGDGSGPEASGPGYFQSDRNSKGSGSSGEEKKFGGVGDMGAPSSAVTRDNEGKTLDDLTRRGSVDERAMTMRGPRLFVANPDLSD